MQTWAGVDDFKFQINDIPPMRARKLEALRKLLRDNYALAVHTHEIADINGLQAILDALAAGIQAYRVPGYFTATPISDETLHIHSVVSDIYFPANFAGSQAAIGIDPTATFTITIYRNPVFTALKITDGEIVGTLEYSTAGVVTWASTNGDPVQFEIGDVIGLKAPTSADATAAVASFTLYALIEFIANFLLLSGDHNTDGLSLIEMTGDESGYILLSGDEKYGE